MFLGMPGMPGDMSAAAYGASPSSLNGTSPFGHHPAAQMGLHHPHHSAAAAMMMAHPTMHHLATGAPTPPLHGGAGGHMDALAPPHMQDIHAG